MTDLRTRLARLVGPATTEQIIEILNEEAAERCRDADCVRWWPHSRLGRHRWAHATVPPVSFGLFGPRCFSCGQPSWTCIHRRAKN